MNDDLNDTQLDADVDALARPEPPHDHVAQVLARTGGRDASPRRPDTHALPTGPGLRAAGYLRPRWVLPIAAAIAVLGATWQMARMPVTLPDTVTARSENGPYPPLDPRIDLPVLPPQAYWGMDAFTEFETLRPGVLTRAPTRARDISRPSALAQTTSVDDELAWVPLPSGLAPIELPSILPAPLVVAPLTPLEDIALAEIPIEPIVIAPLVEEERP